MNPDSRRQDPSTDSAARNAHTPNIGLGVTKDAPHCSAIELERHVAAAMMLPQLVEGRFLEFSSTIG
jgi:hypothetical protein